MKIKTTEDLQSKLEKDLSWRKKELTALRMAIEESDYATVNIHIRGGMLLLYAHWEGFIKKAIKVYLMFLNEQNLDCGQVADHLLFLKMKSALLQASKDGSKRLLPYVDVFHGVLTRKSGETFRVRPEHISTESNLNYGVLIDLLFSIGVNKAPFELRKNFIDYKLVDKRNGIAHGEHIMVVRDESEQKEETEDFISIYEVILDLIDTFKDALLTAAVQRTYLARAGC
ncbi:MAE_28990/MAE_18760 family HEPN-like nuclease [Aureibacillus halotolerans]|uniref:MAE-28990/MAE-18760-like HEPN domain-containing protein n=1 Tax=Aureibacillus halotolerans TaxID=1508390 RepID=A0A4V3D4Q4_9BACI|nr:MAE_28990/MAE_18760 family HEPN-like nuclease [Aureibacillus halotolerans]TDQ37137.1 hypothetical protein EV213_11416 [Aureibacillus halotolerans]